jgi:hypothetical protein
MRETRDELVTTTVEVVCGLEPHLKASAVRGAVESSLPSVVGLRRVARTLHRDPMVLTGPAGSRCVADIEPLIRSIVPIGGTAVRLPLCADCGRNTSETYSRKLNRRICRTCAMARWQPDEGPCNKCGKVRRQVYRARNGGWLCWSCRPELDVDHAAAVRAGIAQLHTGLSDVEIDTVASVFRTAKALRELDWILHDTPEVFTGQAPHRSAVSVRLAELLIAAGASGIRPLQCPLCFRNVRPSCALDGVRCCHRCWSHRRSRGLCARCGQYRHLTNRDGVGEYLCTSCIERDPVNHQNCSQCGRADFITHRDGDMKLCRRCYRVPTATCSSCGRVRQCHRINSGKPLCGTCVGKQRVKQVCSRCQQLKLVHIRTDAGEPLCGPCGRKREPCARCGKNLQVSARLDGVGPLCSACLEREPAYFSDCVRCGAHGRMYHRGLCNDCACPGVLRDMFTDEDGHLGGAAAQVMDVLLRCEPRPVLRWAQRTARGPLVQGIRSLGDTLDHAALDGLPPSKSVEWLRNVLVDANALPRRDEYLRRTEMFIDARLRTLDNRDDKVAVRTFSEWHHLRKLRQRAEKRPLTVGDGAGIRHEIRIISEFVADLHQHGRCLATCRQEHVDDWLIRKPTRGQIHQFLSWAVSHGYAHDLKAPMPEDRRTRRTLAGDDERWRLIQYLIEEPGLEAIDRVAGLLVLLYSQQTTRLVTVRVADVTVDESGSMKLKLGTVPITVPAPVDRLFAELVEQRRGYAAVTVSENLWLFPGGRSGRHMSPSRMGIRLKQIGISPLLARNTALIELAGELPAPVIAKLLGFSVKRAVTWNAEAGNTNAQYAAAVARGSRRNL